MKHAFMIMAHNNFELLHLLVEALDHNNHHLFIHIDKKTKGFNFRRLEEECQNCQISFIEREYVSWGAYSLILCELNLLEAAMKSGGHDYYHLLSGVDFPIKPISSIHDFYKSNRGKEFVHINHGWAESPKIIERFIYYHPFQEISGSLRGKRVLHKLSRGINLLFRLLQKHLLPINRKTKYNPNIDFYGGMNWFSITHNFATYVLGEKEWIEKTFQKGFCVDEIFIQTLLMNSSFAKNRYIFDPNDPHETQEGSMRLIDWERGKPYTWQYSDLEEIKRSPCLFARKFSYSTPESKALIHTLLEISKS